MAPLIAQLIASGVGLLGNALLAKGKEEVEKRLGVELPDVAKEVTPEQIEQLRNLEFAHEERLLELSIRAKEVELESERVEQAAVTDRWRADMTSDSWLSKNMRPLVLAYLTGAISIMAFASQWLKVDGAWIDLLATAYVTVIAAYFGSRGVEKVMAGRRDK